MIKVLSSLVASISALHLYAAPPQTSPANECPPSYFLDSRGVMGELYGTLLFLQPNGSSLYYAAEAIPLNQSISNTPVGQAVSPSWKIFELDPNYSAAFKVGGKLLFSPSHTNLEASWERFQASTNASVSLSPTADGGALMIGPLFDIGPNSAAYTNAKGRAHFHFDAVDLVFGQGFCAFNRLYPNLFAGVGFTHIKQQLKSTYSNVGASSVRSIDTSSSFIGFGPKIGLNFDYRVACDFFLSGTSSCGLLVGQAHNKTTYQSNTPFLLSNGITDNIQTTKVPNRTQLVPGFEEKLGLSYIKSFKCWKLKVEAGYQAEVYLNAVQTIDMTAPQVPRAALPGNIPDSGVYAVGFERTLSNFILTGPYLCLSIDF